MSSYVQRLAYRKNMPVSVTLFALNVILSVAFFALNYLNNGNRTLALLYVDDLQLSYRHSDLHVIKVKLQDTVNKIEEWITSNGFKWSLNKIKVVRFANKVSLASASVILSIVNFLEQKM